MLIGVVGAPNKGKSTFFSAATHIDVAIADYPFTTIKANEGMGFVRVPCVCSEFKVKCNPQNSKCIEGNRFIPVKLLDVAGLVPGAHEGKGLGNQFLEDLRTADALIQIVDASGRSDLEGKKCELSDPEEEIKFLREEIKLWVKGILDKKGRTTEEQRKEMLKGLKMKSLEELKDIVIGANKIDIPCAHANYEKLKEEYETVVPLFAVGELALRKALDKGLIHYIPGDVDFQITGNVDESQKKALEAIRGIMKKYDGTGVQKLLNYTVLEVLGCIAVFPVEDENKLSDSKGNVLPHAYLLPPDSTALDLANKVHTDLGDNFIGAIDVRTKRKVGKEHVLKNGDVIKILAR